MKIGTSIAEMILMRIKATPDWMVENDLPCDDDEAYPFWHEDAETFIAEVCGKCPVQEECRTYTEEMVENGRDINSGVWHGEDYYKE